MNDASRLIAYRKRQDWLFGAVGLVCTAIGIATLIALLLSLSYEGLPHLSWKFLTSNSSAIPERAGILTALVGTLYVMVVTFVIAVPMGVAAAVFLEEYAGKNWFASLIEINISNLAGVPSIIYGLMALSLFGYIFGLHKSVIVGGMTLALLVLPIIIVATREAIRTVPFGIREAAYAAGATKWQTIWYHLLPYSLGGIATGTIIAMSRAIGETAPLLVIGAAGYISRLPPSPITSKPPFLSLAWLNSSFTVLPMQMYNWTADADPELQSRAATTGLVLIVLTLSINAGAIALRYRVRKRLKW
jgi:phosphate transport system permease protein